MKKNQNRRPRTHVMAFRFITYKSGKETIKIFNPYNSDVPVSLSLHKKQWVIVYDEKSPVNTKYVPQEGDFLFEQLSHEERWKIAGIRIEARKAKGEQIPDSKVHAFRTNEALRYLGKLKVVQVTKKM